jgi:hypothetical protein
MESARSVFDYLSTCSEPAVESFELSRLNRAAILRKQMRQLIDEWVACEAEAQIARWTRQSRRDEMPVAAASLPDAGAALPKQLALPLLPPSTRVPSKGSHQPSGGQLIRVSGRGATNRATRTETTPSPTNLRAAERAPYKNKLNSHSARFAPLLASESRSRIARDSLLGPIFRGWRVAAIRSAKNSAFAHVAQHRGLTPLHGRFTTRPLLCGCRSPEHTRTSVDCRMV